MNEFVELSKAGQLTGIYFIITCFFATLCLAVWSIWRQNKELRDKLDKISEDYTTLLVKFTKIDLENERIKEENKEIKEENKTLQEQLNRIFTRLNHENV